MPQDSMEQEYYAPIIKKLEGAFDGYALTTPEIVHLFEYTEKKMLEKQGYAKRYNLEWKVRKIGR